MSRRSAHRMLYGLVFLAGLGWISYLCFNSPGTPVQDEIGHYLLAKSAWQYPVVILNLWGRSANTLFYMPAAIGGLQAARFFSIAAAAITVLLTTSLAGRIGLTWLFLIPAFLWFQPWFPDLSYTVITEVPFSLCLVLGIYLAIHRRNRWAALCFGLLPLIRYEGIVLTVAWMLYAARKRDWLAVLIAPLPFMIHNFVYFLVFGRWSIEVYLTPTPTDLYGSGGWFHFAGPLLADVGLPLIILSLISIAATIKLKMKALIFAPYLIYLVVHVTLYRFGLFASGGYELFLLPLAPAFALAAALGLASIRDALSRILDLFGNKPRVWLIVQAGAAIVCMIVIIYGVLNTHPRPADPEGVAAEQAANWLRSSGLTATPIVSTHVWFTYYYYGLMTPDRVWVKMEPLSTMSPGTVLVWDKHYSPRWGYTYEILSDPASGWQLLGQFGETTFAVFRKMSSPQRLRDQAACGIVSPASICRTKTL